MLGGLGQGAAAEAKHWHDGDHVVGNDDDDDISIKTDLDGLGVVAEQTLALELGLEEMMSSVIICVLHDGDDDDDDVIYIMIKCMYVCHVFS